MILTRKYSFQAARKLTKIDPKHICANLHGHTFHVTIKIEGKLSLENTRHDLNKSGKSIKYGKVLKS